VSVTAINRSSWKPIASRRLQSRPRARKSTPSPVVT
jgi:hypothetical protein